MQSLAGLAIPVASTAAAQRLRIVDLGCEITIPAGGSVTSLWIPVPQTGTSQRIEKLRFSGIRQHAIHAGTHGNRYFFARVAPGATVTVQFRVTRRTPRRSRLATRARSFPRVLPGPGSPRAARPSHSYLGQRSRA